ncbi:uncharacterized protein LOC120429119 isoform X2 [Culex pipiens pallens]|uniref:uncharacterized protein LOC120429119 isoform X2 n=1 Tax=Culex pipiens pallens TaxID=42434 RepID=UPI001952CF87|nr:uncharacterized protein LOC120429119 isoform X2 [Culex pipiens pallens]
MDPIEDMECNIAQDLNTKSVPKEPEMEPEKVDLSPENSKKSDNSPTDDQISKQKTSDEADGGEEKVQYSNCNLHSGINECVNKSMSLREVKEKKRCASEDPEVRNALAFTIDFGEGRKSVDVQRHEKMLERFQNRHKRGVSLSKLETNPLPSVGKISSPQSVNLPRKLKNNSSETPTAEVKLRDKNRSLKDSSKNRHSWSPRTSMSEAAASETSKQCKPSKFTPKSNTLQMAFENPIAVKDYCSSSEINAESLDSSIGLPCIEPPLKNFKSDDNDDSISEAGTYTLDGDNYTEEQKERMNIDKIPAISEAGSKHYQKSEYRDKTPQRPTNFQDDLEVIDLTEQPSSYKPADDKKMNNVLEVSYFHDQSAVHPIKQKQSYLEKLKSRVKNITHKARSPEKQIQQHQMNSPDQGTFTSVTTSGILSVKPCLEDHPRMHRRNSLTKSYVDSSEYVQGVAKLNILSKGEAKILNCYTDTEKASGIQELSGTYDSSRRKTGSDASVISSAVSKKDWIQEWAKTAREYSKSPAVGTSTASSSQMTRSYDFENRNQFGYDFDIDMTKSDYYDAKKYEEFGDNLDRHKFHRKQLDHIINNNSSSSDPTMRPNFGNENNSYNEFTRQGSIRQNSRSNASKPPMSPSKIPSPIGSVGRARSVSRNRSLQGSNSDLSTNETEMYLQKTAAAISTLQNIHRRNSIRSTTQHNSSHSSPLSPASRRMSPKISPMNSFQAPVHNLYNDKSHCMEGALLSPQHQQIRNIKQQQQIHQQSSLNHKRNLSLDDSDSYINVLSSLEYGNQMSNSLNTDNANAILDFKKQHTRHNSFEGMSTLPPKPVKCFQNFDQATAYYSVRSNNESIMCDDDENEQNDENLLTLTTRVKGLSLSTMKPNEQRVTGNQKMITPTVGKPSVNTIKPTAASTSRTSMAKTSSAQMSSPIKRSSSFSVKAMKPTTPTMTPKLGSRPSMSNTKIQKSASSTSFKKIVANFKDDEDDFYINNDDDLELNPEYSSNSEFSDRDDDTEETEKEPITNTRYNKTFLMRMEQNKKLSAGGKQGVAACPNTPELPRRTLQIKGATRDRASMPRDSSLNRMKQDLNISRKSVSKELASFKEPTSAGKQKVQPKYLDISKYKTPAASNFLKKDESKSYLAKTEVKKSPSSASIALGRTEHNRMSTRSVKSAGAKLPNAKKEAQRNSKEQELEMWRRRASYDPMKAAQEGKRKQEEAKRTSRQPQPQAERPTPF